ncbi:MAG: beta-ketoacyl-ACP synthase 3 [Chloroflexota bacterium]
MLPVKIAGLGYYLPERRVLNAELEERLHIPEGWIERVTGVRERRYVTNETSLGMATAASRSALEASGIPLEEIDLIVGASTAPHQSIPCTAALAQRELGAPDGGSACFDVNATCLSFLFALQTVSHLVAAGVYRNALIFSSEISRHSLNPSERESAVLFGDAAAAAVVTRSAPGEANSVWHSLFNTYASGADFTRIVGGGTRHHPNDGATTPEMNMFQMNGPAIFKMGMKVMGPFLQSFFSAIEIDRATIDAVVPHQASRHAIELLTARGGFRDEQVVSNIATRGNCIAASIPLALAEAVESGRIVRGNSVFLVGSGAGLTLGGVALTY